MSVPADPLLDRVGWMLLHGLWQGILVALCLKAALHILPSRSARQRYSTSLAALVAMVALPFLTFVFRDAREQELMASSMPPPTAHGEEAGQNDWTAGIASRLRFPAVLSSALDRRITITAREGLATAMPWLAPGWLAGTACCLAFMAYGLLQLHRVRRRAVPPASGLVEARAREVGRRMGLLRHVASLESDQVDAPCVLGMRNPAILIPRGAGTLAIAELDAVLAHELAHVRRHDGCINTMHRVLEAVFFFHPAVWWVSRQVRRERESCCDDIAVETCGNPLVYARALVSLEEGRGHALHPSALSALSCSLSERIHRVLGKAPCHEESRRWILLGQTPLLAGLTLFLAAVVCGAARECRYRIEGAVRDLLGHPIHAAEIGVRYLHAGSLVSESTETIATSDSSGRWRLDAPRGWTPAPVILDVRHETHVQATSLGKPKLTAKGALSASVPTITLGEGLLFSCRVIDEQGEPVCGARIRFGLSQGSGLRDVGRTHEDGTLTTRSIEGGLNVVVAEAPGFAMSLQSVAISRSGIVMTCTLRKAVPLRGRVIDARGRPIQGARVCADAWGHHLMLRLFETTTGSDGGFVWPGAPPDEVLFDVAKEGSMSLRRHPLAPSESEHSLVLRNPLRVGGKVIDFVTGQPIPGGTIQCGIELLTGERRWLPDGLRRFHGGLYQMTIDMPLSSYIMPARAYVFRAQADGYSTEILSPCFQEDASDRSCDFSLKSAFAR